LHPLHPEPVESATLESFEEAMRSNLYSAVHCTFAALDEVQE
jgi:NAD(P)-dependent dehydrogenase (short-subunit alcohol dehydrogenase family)